MEREDRLKARAYDIWEREGKPDGRSADHWAQAEQEMDEADGEAGAAPPAGLSSSFQPSGTAPGAQPGATVGSVGTGGGSTSGEASGNVLKRRAKSGE